MWPELQFAKLLSVNFRDLIFLFLEGGCGDGKVGIPHKETKATDAYFPAQRS